MNPFIYLRGLRHVDYSVFCVEKGQKSYWDDTFNTAVPFSSGQQVKRSIIEKMIAISNSKFSKTTFVFAKEKLAEEEVYGTCDPRDFDQLIGGWMKTPKGGHERTLKRRSPLSISAMRPLHPLLAGIKKENLTFDRTNTAEINNVIVRDSKGYLLNKKEIAELLEGTDKSLNRKWIPENSRASGLYVYDVAIDLRRLFCVSPSLLEPELSYETIEELKNENWIKIENDFGECLVAPKEIRDKLIPSLAHALINWRITSNQSRTFSLMETLAIVISDNANKIPSAIRAKLLEDSDRPKVKPIIEDIPGADLFISLACAGYMITNNESVDALEQAENQLIEMMRNFDYENQV